MSVYKVYVCNDLRMTFSGDFTQASSPLLLEGDSTPFNVGDAQHMVGRAATLLNRWCYNKGMAAWSDDEDFEIINCEI
jgi:hypothetical protein